MAVNLKSTSTALIVVDVQNDFLPAGALPVPHSDQIIAPVNMLIDAASTVVLTADWHPENHESFACSHPGRRPFETIEMPYGLQVLWPIHCVAGSHGASFATELKTQSADLILRKGTCSARDSYSAFIEADRKTATGLSGWLKERGITDVVVCGLAADYCVSWTALDAVRAGFRTTVVIDAVKAIAEESYEEAKRTWKSVGIETVTLSELNL